MATSLNTRKTATRLPWKCGTFFLLLSPCYMQDSLHTQQGTFLQNLSRANFSLVGMNYFCRFVMHGAEICVYSKHYYLRGWLKPPHFNFFWCFHDKLDQSNFSLHIFFAPCSFGLCSTFRPFMWVWETIKFIWRKRSGFEWNKNVSQLQPKLIESHFSPHCAIGGFMHLIWQ